MELPLGKQSSKTRHRTSKLSERERVGTTDEQFIEQLRTVGLVRAAERMQELLRAVEAEREACAALCDAEHKWLAKIVDRDGAGAAAQCAHKIRARGDA